MSSQAIHDIVLGMRRAVKRAEEGSDTDEPVDMVSNRGNKLNKRAKYVHEGQLASPSRYRVNEEITYGDGGYKRNIISHIPKVYDEDGYEIDPEDDDERYEEAIAEVAEDYPYSGIRIEELLAPLTSASDLPIHPTMSIPFTSKILKQLTQNACDMLRKERASLWKMKHLLTRLGGDHIWAPTGIFERRDDIETFTDGRTLFQEPLLQAIRTAGGNDAAEPSLDDEGQDVPAIEVIKPVEEARIGGSIAERTYKDLTVAGNDAFYPEPPSDFTDASRDDVAMIDAPETATGPPDWAGGISGGTEASVADVHMRDKWSEGVHEDFKAEAEPDLDETLIDDSTLLEEDQLETGPGLTNGHKVGEEDVDEEAQQEEDEVPEPRRMRTRAQAQAASDESNPHTRSVSPDSESYIDPFFLPPPTSIPDRNNGIPEPEAEEVRRCLQLYIQKQEEVCRGAERVYNGLLKAERMRKTVLKWAKAEGHVGEMSDGEDWYDDEEWNLSEPLKKGQDEEEEDAATTAKKTRTRRQ